MGVTAWGGGPPDTLANPPLGGAGGWAASVAAALNNSDVTVNDRIAAHNHTGTYWGLWTGTQAAYDAITTKDPNTLYVVV